MPYHRFIIHPSLKKTSKIIPNSIRSKRNQSNLHLVNYFGSSCGGPSVVCPSIICDVLQDSVDSDPAHHQRPRHDDKGKPLFSVSCLPACFRRSFWTTRECPFAYLTQCRAARVLLLFLPRTKTLASLRGPRLLAVSAKKKMHASSRESEKKYEFYTHIKPSSKSAEIISHS